MRNGFDKATVNKAIRDVIINQYKKNCKEAHQLVEDAGYKITKIEGGWRVDNLETGKFVYLNFKDYNWRKGYALYRCTYYGKTAYVNYSDEAECKFDFVNCLDLNRRRYYECASSNKETAVSKYRRLHSAKWSINYDKKRLAETQKKIEELQKDLVRYAKEIVRDEARLEEVRKEIGLTA